MLIPLILLHCHWSLALLSSRPDWRIPMPPRSHGCQMAIARFFGRRYLALGLEGLWLRYATLQNLIPSFPWIAPHALHPGAIQGKEGTKFCHLATLLGLPLSTSHGNRGTWRMVKFPGSFQDEEEEAPNARFPLFLSLICDLTSEGTTVHL